ncbi:MAG: chromosomal replication initiator protein DnaA [Candidatus Scalindua rubra]|uniref:Chromosomal replication initiator protein DnaA n=1 Tax=Candidatus Scalindua rubra TaxID=1872076 RepID=A0A1E3XBA5_9BACT|nr:MAG: chromosomal replication initiator protein DnaA [Candidatus Scalindua rubra]
MSHLSKGEKQTWLLIREKIREKTTPQQFTTWFAGLCMIKFNVDEICVLAPNTYCKEWLEDNYSDFISSVVNEVTNTNYKLKLIVKDRKNPADYDPSTHYKLHPTDVEKRTYINKNYNFKNFLVGPCNRLAHAAALAVSDAPGTAYNPLFIHGPVGLGKTHLLHAILLHIQKRSNQFNTLYLPCESFVNHYISTIKSGDWDAFRKRYRQIDVLLIDDIHFLSNSQSTREEFFHTFNALYSRRKQIVLSSDCPPEDIPTIEDRLISRFKWGLMTRIDPPSFETSVAIIQKKTALLNINISYEAVRYLAVNASSSIREIEGTLINIARHASLSPGKSKIDISLIKQVIKSFTRQKNYIGIEEILNSVTKNFGVQLSQLHSKRKLKSIILPRQIAMYLARKLTNLSLEEIGGYMGGRDHTTVIHADKKIRKLKKIDRNISITLRKIESELTKQHKH